MDETYRMENITTSNLMSKPTLDNGRGTQGDDRTNGGRKRKTTYDDVIDTRKSIQ